jgi:Mrp family chromosome partitioning ATPase
MKIFDKHLGPPSRSVLQSDISMVAGALLRMSVTETATDSISSKVIGITSARQAEGVTTVALLLAREVAGPAARRTLLLNSSDLDLLASKETYELDTVFSEDDVFGYWKFDPSKALAGYSSQWRTSTPLVRSIFHSLRARFDVIIVDSRSILDFDDIPTLACCLDEVILVVQANRSKKMEIQQAMDLVQLAGCELKGIVLNRRQFPIPEYIYRWLRSR